MTRTSDDKRERERNANVPAKKKKKLLEKLNHKNIGDGTDDKVEIDALTVDVKMADKDDRPLTVDEVLGVVVCTPLLCVSGSV